MPVHWAIRNGDPEIGVTVHWMDEEFDTGPIIIQQGGIPVEDEIVPEQLWHRVECVAADLLGRALERIAAGHPGDPQDNSLASYAGRMEPGFSFVDWGRPVKEIHNQVRSFRLGFAGARGPLARVGNSWMVVLATRTEPGDGLRAECADGSIWIVDSAPVAGPSRIDRAAIDLSASSGAQL
jgi:methionyl-tRNA formyltransferase